MCKKNVKKSKYNEKMPTDSWSKRRICCGIKSRAKEERNALTEIARTGQREQASDVGTNDKERTAEPFPNTIRTEWTEAPDRIRGNGHTF